MITITDSAGGIITFSRAAVLSVAVIILAIAIAFYVLRGFGIYALAKKYGVKYPILAWFPFTWFYVAGLLLGDVALFGKKFEKFALVSFIIFTVTGVFYNVLEIVYYFPMLGYYLQGGDINIVSSTAGTKIIMNGFLDPYSDAFKRVLNILFYIARPLNIISLLVTVLVYSNFFKIFLPNHYFIATIFSVFGFFGPWAFVVRNNDRINYADYMRARYTAFYGANSGYGGGNGGYGGNGGTYASPRAGDNNGSDDPFGDMDGENKSDKSGKSGSDDPFGEFDSKK